MKFILFVLSFASFCASCKVLNSYTTIKANDSFVLGNNEHGRFSVQLKNVSAEAVHIYQMPPSGERLAMQSIAPHQSVSLTVARNTALVIANKTASTANVKLKVSGDTGLSMQYNAQ